VNAGHAARQAPEQLLTPGVSFVYQYNVFPTGSVRSIPSLGSSFTSTVVPPAVAAAALDVAAALLATDAEVVAGAALAEAVVAGALADAVVAATEADTVVAAVVPPQPARTSVSARIGMSGRLPLSDDKNLTEGVSFSTRQGATLPASNGERRLAAAIGSHGSTDGFLGA
jgi:hypothetical protein